MPLEVPGAATGSREPPDPGTGARPGDVGRPRDPADGPLGEHPQWFGKVRPVGRWRGRAGQEAGTVDAARLVRDEVSEPLEVHGGRHAGPVGVQPGPAVRHHRLRQRVERVPAHAVAPVRLPHPGPARPPSHLEEDADPRIPAPWRAVVDGDRRAHIGRHDEDTGLLAGLPDHPLDHVLARVEVPGGQVPEPGRVHGPGPARQQYLRAEGAVAAQDEVDVDRHRVPGDRGRGHG